MYNTMIIAFYSNYVNYMQPKTVVTNKNFFLRKLSFLKFMF